MAINRTRWKPDTCDCVLEYEWDSSVDPAQRTHSIARVVRACAAHAGSANASDHFEKVKEENVRKNTALARIVGGVDEIVDVKQVDGQTMRELKRGKVLNWYFNDQRDLVIRTVGLTDPEHMAVDQIVKANVPKAVVTK